MRAQASAIPFLLAGGVILAAAGDPPVPAGRDPGGTPVAIIGQGIDYTRAEIPQRLARDGEGEIVGYDFADDDRRPFASGESGKGNSVAIVLGEGQATSLVALRYDRANLITLAKALDYAGRSPAQIVLAADAPQSEKDFVMLASAARHYRDRLFVVPAGDDGRDLDPVMHKQARNVGNVMLVAASDGEGRLSAHANWGATTVDISTDGRDLKNPFSAKIEPDAPATSSRAAARIAALAARVLAVEPFIAGAGLKARILGLADLSGREAPARTRAGDIARPWRHFWLE